jgi:hypothetical protein
MADIGLAPQNPWLAHETTQPKTEIVKPAPKIKSKLPEYIQNQADEIINQSKEKKEIELKIESVFEALENRYSNFDRTKFKIDIAPLLQEEIDYLWYELFIVSNNQGIEISFVDNTGETIIDLQSIKLDDFKHSLTKKASWNYFIRWEDWRLSFYISENWKSYWVKHRHFTNAIIKYENIQPNNIQKNIVELSSEEETIIGWKMIAIYQWDTLLRYEIWNDQMINLESIDINNEFWNLLSKRVNWLYFEKLKNWKIILHMWDWKILNQNDNKFHKAVWMELWRLKEPIQK